jgi:hypothetical protein
LGVKSHLYNNSKEPIVLSGCEKDVTIKVGESLKFIACDNLMIKTKDSRFKYFDFVPLSIDLNKIDKYVTSSFGSFLVYFQFNDDGKIYISADEDIPILSYDDQPEGFPILGASITVP